MVEIKSKESHPWWFDSHNKSSSNRSPWLQTTLSELDEKTKTMLKLVEEDADSFAQRAEMYYKKRPELIRMVEDFYRTHRSLAERFDQVKSEPGSRLLSSPWSSPLSFTKYRLEKSHSLSLNDKAYDSYSEVYGPDEESEESEVDDPEEEVEEETGQNRTFAPETEQVEEVMRLKEEVKRLRDENEAQRAQLKQKDEEKREVIRQLSLAVDSIREENVKMRECLSKKTSKKENNTEFVKLKENFLGRLFSGFGKTPVNLVAV